MNKNNFLRISAIVLQLLFGLVFIFSAVSKIPTLEKFGWTIVETTFFNWTIAEWLARILIGVELAIGVLFSLQLTNKFIFQFSILLILIFSGYLIAIMPMYGDGNCGCFGDVLPMSPKVSLIKNAILLLLLFLIYKLNFSIKIKFKHVIILILSILCILFPFFKNPPESVYIYEKEEFKPTPIPLSILYNSKNNLAPKKELRKGKHIISFMSLHCKFCKKAATRMAIMYKKNPSLPFQIIYNGDSSALKEFFEETKAEKIPYLFFNGAAEFIKLNDGTALPTIKWVEDTTIIKTSNYLNFDEKEVLEWAKLHP
jgi:glutaredoxin